MGRHSRPEDSGEDDAAAGAPVDEERRGRHAQPLPGGSAPGPALPPAEVTAAPAARRRPFPSRRANSATAADLQLVRVYSDVRNRCLAALLVPYVVYIVVIVALGRTDVFLTWVWAPIVLGGVLVGVMLDHGHRRHPTDES